MIVVQRYKNLKKEVALCKPKTIVEVGTWKGVNGSRMIREAQKYNEDIEYYGFDIFEDIDPEIKKKEKHVKPNIVGDDAYEILKETGATINLYRGYTNATLPNFKPNKPIDFIYIDGGHSLETIDNDWTYLKPFVHSGTVVLFDDYYNNNTKEGSFNLISELKKNSDYKVELLDPEDVIHAKLAIRFVKVTSSK